MSPAALGNGHYLEGHSTSPRVMIPATVPSTKLHAQVPTASGLISLRSLLVLYKYCRIGVKIPVVILRNQSLPITIGLSFILGSPFLCRIASLPDGEARRTALHDRWRTAVPCPAA
jgi:hypothetical protein